MRTAGVDPAARHGRRAVRRHNTGLELMTISSDPRQWQVGMLGYGEVGRILAEDLRQQGIKVAAYDIKLDRGQGAPLRAHAAETGVVLAESHADLAARADLIISAVTASQAVAVAEACAPA
ncbi:NAD(P)-dependent oxidoreductase, partial [Ralstonia solanacearum]|uniref:NAD(P)-dependent oxidoreductase n=1 Tax=Ralstonia solanacearum TaxID=305 RepID=UPI00399D6C34